MTPDEAGEFPKETVEEFAKELMRWAGQDEERETLVKWLLTRTVSHRFQGTGGELVITKVDIDEFDIVKAVTHAMTECKPNPGPEASGWVRGGWPRLSPPGGWLKAYGC